MKKLFDKRKFQQLEKDKTDFLKNLSLEKSVKIFENLTSRESLNEFKDHFTEDYPLGVKITLKRKKSGIPSGSI
ncbi:MAG TPA: hypothetical protein VII00_08205 [bacterium]